MVWVTRDRPRWVCASDGGELFGSGAVLEVFLTGGRFVDVLERFGVNEALGTVADSEGAGANFAVPGKSTGEIVGYADVEGAGAAGEM